MYFSSSFLSIDNHLILSIQSLQISKLLNSLFQIRQLFTYSVNRISVFNIFPQISSTFVCCSIFIVQVKRIDIITMQYIKWYYITVNLFLNYTIFACIIDQPVDSVSIIYIISYHTINVHFYYHSFFVYVSCQTAMSFR